MKSTLRSLKVGVEGSQEGGVGERLVRVMQWKGWGVVVRYSTNRFPRILVPCVYVLDG